MSASSLGDRDDGLAVVPGLLHGLHTDAEAGLVPQHLGEAAHQRRLASLYLGSLLGDDNGHEAVGVVVFRNDGVANCLEPAQWVVRADGHRLGLVGEVRLALAPAGLQHVEPRDDGVPRVVVEAALHHTLVQGIVPAPASLRRLLLLLLRLLCVGCSEVGEASSRTSSKSSSCSCSKAATTKTPKTCGTCCGCGCTESAEPSLLGGRCTKTSKSSCSRGGSKPTESWCGRCGCSSTKTTEGRGRCCCGGCTKSSKTCALCCCGGTKPTETCSRFCRCCSPESPEPSGCGCGCFTESSERCTGLTSGGSKSWCGGGGSSEPCRGRCGSKTSSRWLRARAE